MLLQNLAPGAAARLGLSHADLAPRHPGLIVCDISGYGESGPFAQKKAYDLLIQAESGVISVTGTEETPSRVGISVADIATGMYALSGILAALVRRGRTGEGANVKIAMLDALAEWMTYPMYRVRLRQVAAAALADQPPGAGAVRRAPHQGRSGHLRPAERARMGDVLRQGAGAAGARRPTRGSATTTPAASTAHELTELIEDYFADMTSIEVVKKLDAAGIANGRLNEAQDVWDHVQLTRARPLARDQHAGRPGPRAAAAIHLH